MVYLCYRQEPIEEEFGMTDEQFISFEEAETDLGVTRATLHYYMRALDIERKKFPLDKRAYMRVSDLERIKRHKEASQRSGPRTEGEAA
jgi:hypothetical protein